MQLISHTSAANKGRSCFSHTTLNNKQQGFSMLEVLITVVISAFGLIGLAGLQISSVNATTASSANTQTMIAMKEMVGQLLANSPAAKNGEFNILAVNSGEGNAVTLQTFSADLEPANDATSSQTIAYRWFNNLNNAIPGVRAGIYCSSSGSCAIKVQLNESLDSMEQVISVQL